METESGNAEGGKVCGSIEVKLKDKADLMVRVRRGFFDVEPTPVAKKGKEEKPADRAPKAC